jgi:hypothetical protein
MRTRAKKFRTLPSKSLPSTSPVELFLLAGLPHPEHSRAEKSLKRIAGPYAKIVAVPSSSWDGNGRLFPPKTIDALLRGAVEFATRRLKNRSDDQVSQPRHIVLFYVPADDDQDLLAAFDFFVFPVPLRELASFDETGQQRRHQPTVCDRSIETAFGVCSRDLFGIVKRRIDSRRSSEPLLLPPINFHLPGARLQKTFFELTRGARAWEHPLPEIAAETFDRKRLPNFLGHQEHQVIYRDARKVVFPCARASELHGRLPDVESAATVPEMQDLLRSAYRFGAPLPEGFHHDAQLEDGRNFHQMEFNCSRKGSILINASHANIYPNDYVRVGA